MDEEKKAVSLKAVSVNAERLLNDAEYLYEGGRWASATALAILSMEEVGKHFITKRDYKKTKLHHSKKQAIIGSFYLMRALIYSLGHYIQQKGYDFEISGETEEEKKTQFRRGLSKLITARLDEFADFTSKDVKNYEFSDLVEKAETGQIDKIKQSALYADLGSNGVLISNPSKITQEIALEWIEHARFALSICQNKIHRTQKRKEEGTPYQ